MKTDRINSTLTLLANVGILIGLVFLLVELRQNQASLDATIQLSLSASYQDIASRPIENREFAEVLGKVFTDPDSMDMLDTIQMMSWSQEYLAMLYAAYELRQQDVISEAVWQQHAKYFAAFLANPNYREFFDATMRSIYPEAFFVAIENHIPADHH